MPRASTRTESQSQAHATLAARLRARRPEIEQAAIARLFAVSEPATVPDPEYMEGLRAAIYAGLEYLLSAVELGEERSPQPPPAVLVQARMAARCGVSLDTALRRCFAGYTLFGDFLLQEAEQGDLLTGTAMKLVLRTQATLFDRLVAAVTEEYAREEKGCRDSSEERRAKRIERLLTGEPLDTAEFAYDFEAHHLGAIARGPEASAMLHELAAALDRCLLAVRREEQGLWAWLGGRRPLDSAQVRRQARSMIAPGTALAIGEPGCGFAGWRLTHQQARAALPIAQRGPEPMVRYVDVALFAAVLQDDLLATSLRELYLTPLKAERGGGEVLRETMRAYFAAEGNVSSAASALGVKRETVRNRLRAIEERLGRDLSTCAADMETALRLEEMTEGHSAPSDRSETDRLPARADAVIGEAGE
jgi:hypothetical protein